jgi:hypothetical protein
MSRKSIKILEYFLINQNATEATSYYILYLKMFLDIKKFSKLSFSEKCKLSRVFRWLLCEIL